VSEARSVCSEVEVAADPVTAFAAFTEEMNLWWVRGPINFFDSARAVAKICEPGVGGRLLEVYDEAAGDTLELGRITVWEPGARLAYRSSVDDTEVDVRFEAVENGTRVSVTQTLLPGGEKALYYWPFVVRWLVRWFEQEEPAPREIARLSIGIHYADPAAAARWLARAFQFGSWSVIPEEGEEPDWIELHHGDAALILFPLEGDGADAVPVTHTVWAYVDDVDAHFEHAKAAGATIVSGIEQHGFRAYTAEDLEGRRWTFAQARPTMR
jgi:uncharacterized glyoxalase superfamily protein PhnB